MARDPQTPGRRQTGPQLEKERARMRVNPGSEPPSAGPAPSHVRASRSSLTLSLPALPFSKGRSNSSSRTDLLRRQLHVQ